MPFRKKPVVIQAVQWSGSNLDEIAKLGGAREYEQPFLGDDLVIKTLEGDMVANKGDWIIKGVEGELYPCKPTIFEKTYEPWIGNLRYQSNHSIDQYGNCNMGCC